MFFEDSQERVPILSLFLDCSRVKQRDKKRLLAIGRF